MEKKRLWDAGADVGISTVVEAAHVCRLSGPACAASSPGPVPLPHRRVPGRPLFSLICPVLLSQELFLPPEGECSQSVAKQRCAIDHSHQCIDAAVGVTSPGCCEEQDADLPVLPVHWVCGRELFQGSGNLTLKNRLGGVEVELPHRHS